MPALKQAWLKVSAESIEKYTCESQQVASEMATGVMTIAPLAHWSAAVVGHLASDQQCMAYVSIARRNEAGEIAIVATADRPLIAATRVERQREAAELVLQLLAEAIETHAHH
jgi:nicotinamide mononucleotide (NMN) deamidase PncC